MAFWDLFPWSWPWWLTQITEVSASRHITHPSLEREPPLGSSRGTNSSPLGFLNSWNREDACFQTCQRNQFLVTFSDLENWAKIKGKFTHCTYSPFEGHNLRVLLFMSFSLKGGPVLRRAIHRSSVSCMPLGYWWALFCCVLMRALWGGKETCPVPPRYPLEDSLGGAAVGSGGGMGGAFRERDWPAFSRTSRMILSCFLVWLGTERAWSSMGGLSWDRAGEVVYCQPEATAGQRVFRCCPAWAGSSATLD